MVQSKAATVDLWMAGLGPERRDAVGRLRGLCLAAFPDWQERLAWGMPGYGPEGEDPRVSFNDQKAHISLYIGEQVVEAHRADLTGVSLGKSCIRYRNPARIEWPLVETMLREAYGSSRAAR